MPNHKLTLLGHPAFKRIQLYLQGHPETGEKRRLAFAVGVIAMSGQEGIQLGRDIYKLDLNSDELTRRFDAMVESYQVKRAELWKIENCAEARLWKTLTGLHLQNEGDGHAPRHRFVHPKYQNIWVYQIDRKFRPKEDSPCLTCRQWVRREYQTVNGTELFCPT